MRIDQLRNQPQLLDDIAAQLHTEWAAYAPWRCIVQIKQRLIQNSESATLPCVWVAWSEPGKLMGTASLTLAELPGYGDQQYWLSEVFIPAHLRGQGIGSALIRTCIAYSQALGIPALYLYTPNQQALYERFGWRTIRTDIVDAETVAVMQLSLASY